MATISQHEISIGILHPKQSKNFCVKFADFSDKLSTLELERLSSQVISTYPFTAFPKSGNVVEIVFEDDKGGMLDAILSKIHNLNISLEVKICLLDGADNIIKVIDYDKCKVINDVYSGLSYGSDEDYSSTNELSSKLPEFDVRLLEKSEWFQLAYTWLSSLRWTNKVSAKSDLYPSTIRRNLSFKKL